MSKHGHVTKTSQGAVARCGGPGMCGHCMGERIVNRGCPALDGRCYYCRSALDEASQGHKPDCIWPPFEKAHS